MVFERFTEDTLDSVRDAAYDVTRVRRKAERVLQSVIEFSELEGWKERTGVTIRPGEAGICQMETPYGAGRLVIEIQIGEKGTEAVLLVEKATRNEFGEAIWKLVWKLVFNKTSTYAADDPSKPISLDSYEYDSAVAEILLSSVYAIGKG